MSALSDVRVLELTQVMAGPFCGQVLADMGADVIKVEPPGGDSTRRSLGTAAFLAVNRNKRSIELDLKDAGQRDTFLRLAETADVVLENNRPGVAARLGVDYETLREVNPRLVYASISGFGQTGPYSQRPGYDLMAQGLAGIMSVTGEPDGNPVKCGIPIGDLSSGLFCAVAILSALHARERTGRGQYIDTSLFEGALALSIWESAELWATGRVPGKLGSAHRLTAPYQALRTADGYITVGGNTQALFGRLCATLGVPQLTEDPRFATNDDRMANVSDLVEELEARAGGEDDRRVGRRAGRGRRAVRADPRLRRGVRRRAHAGARDGGHRRASRRGHDPRARHPREAVGHAGRGAAAGAAARPAHRGDPPRGGHRGPAVSQVLSERRGPALWVTFNRPEAHNAMTFAMYEELFAACEAADADDEVRVLVLRGAGEKAFVAGTDIRQFADFDESGADALAYEATIDRIVGRLETVRKPTVALVDGFAMGSGLALSAACDLRICTPAARFGLPIARTVGNCLSMENYARLAALLGPARLKDIVFTARTIEPDEALATGLATEVVDDAEARVEELCELLASHAPVTLYATKEALRRIRTATTPDGEDLIREAYGSEGFRRNVQAFLER